MIYYYYSTFVYRMITTIIWSPTQWSLLQHRECREKYIRIKEKTYFYFTVDYLDISHAVDNSVDDLPIREFLANNDVTILSALNRGDKLVFLHNVPADENCVIFYKIPQIGGNQQTTDVPLGILTLEGGLTKSIYNSVSRIFSPHVTKVRGRWILLIIFSAEVEQWKVDEKKSIFHEQKVDTQIIKCKTATKLTCNVEVTDQSSAPAIKKTRHHARTRNLLSCPNRRHLM